MHLQNVTVSLFMTMLIHVLQQFSYLLKEDQFVPFGDVILSNFIWLSFCKRDPVIVCVCVCTYTF